MEVFADCPYLENEKKSKFFRFEKPSMEETKKGHLIYSGREKF